MISPGHGQSRTNGSLSVPTGLQRPGENGSSDPCPAHTRVAKLLWGPETLDGPGIFPDEFEVSLPNQQKDPGRARLMTQGRSVMNRIRIGRPRARALSPDPPDPDIVRAKGARAGRAFRKGARHMIAWAGRRLWLAAWMVIRAVKMAHDEQVRMWECVLLSSGAAPLTAAGPLRWVGSLDGYRLDGSHVPAQDLSGTGG
jgi:hypothetical protein